MGIVLIVAAPDAGMIKGLLRIFLWLINILSWSWFLFSVDPKLSNASSF
jgi:hypothetical protein